MDEPVRVSPHAWRCPCGLENSISERPVCACGEWSLDGLVKKRGKADKPAEPEPEPVEI